LELNDVIMGDGAEELDMIDTPLSLKGENLA
jgi:hypothetical protein